MNHYLPDGSAGCFYVCMYVGVIRKEQCRLCVLQENGDVSVRPVITSLLCSSLTTVGDHLGNTLMSLADSKTRFSISVGAVEASALVSDIDLILPGVR